MNQALQVEPDWASMTQKERVLYWLECYGTITQNQGKDNLAVGRVASRINELRKDLKKDGKTIITLDESSKNKFGKTVTYARYKLVIKGELF